MPRNLCWRHYASRKDASTEAFLLAIENPIDVIYQTVSIKISICFNRKKTMAIVVAVLGGRRQQTIEADSSLHHKDRANGSFAPASSSTDSENPAGPTPLAASWL
jgi:hypothetical protein